MDRNGRGLLLDDCVSDRISSLNIGIARVNFTIHCGDAPLASEPQPATYTPFITDRSIKDAGSFTIDVRLKIKDFPSSGELTEIFEGNGSWSMFKKGDEYYLTLNPFAVDGSECITRFDLPLEKAVVYCGEMDILEVEGKRMVRNPFTYPLDQLLLTFALAQREGALLHSSGVDCHGRGFIFSGRSGAGKSTLSRNFALKGYEVLSDDRIVVRRIDNSFRIFGTPWSGEAGIARNKDLPLDGIFFIRHGTEHVIKKITPAEAVERLMPVTSIPWFDEKIVLSLLSFCEDVVSHIPAYELSFKPDIGVVNLFEEFVSE
jgi:hypothetical protein